MTVSKAHIPLSCVYDVVGVGVLHDKRNFPVVLMDAVRTLFNRRHRHVRYGPNA